MTNDMTLNGCTTTHIFCRPNCPPGRRTKPLHRVHFASLEAAFAAGFRPCKVCQPLDGAPGPWRHRSTGAVASQAGAHGVVSGSAAYPWFSKWVSKKLLANLGGEVE